MVCQDFMRVYRWYGRKCGRMIERIIQWFYSKSFYWLLSHGKTIVVWFPAEGYNYCEYNIEDAASEFNMIEIWIRKVEE